MSETGRFRLQAVLQVIFLVVGLGTVIFAQVPVEKVEKADKGEKMRLEKGSSFRADENQSRYSYVFENERFTTPLVEVEFDASGRGRFHFRKKDGRDVTNDLAVSGTLVSQVKSLFEEINFLGSSEDYQHKKDFSHLGKVTLRYSDGGREREASFNYTDNPSMSRLVDIFRNIATQENRVFEIQTMRENDPLSMPAQMRMLESELKSKQIADPHQLVSLLEEIRQDEGLPLIARNHAERLIKSIGKSKS
jgi:hypothetical protein